MRLYAEAAQPGWQRIFQEHLNTLIVKTIVFGLLLGCVFSFNALVFTGKSHWKLNLFIGLVVMGLGSVTDKLIPGIGTVVTFGLGILAARTVMRMER